MDITIKSGKKIVIASGSFITVNKKNEISFKVGKQISIFDFILTNDDKDKSTRVKWKPRAEYNGVELNLINFNSKFGSMIDQSLVLGHPKKDKELSLNFSVRSITDKTKEILYTFYLEDTND